MYVDDEQALVRLVTHALQRLGYQVTGFSDPRKALEVFREQSQQFDAVITDIAMPHLSGPDLAAKLAAIRPQVPIVMTSGYIRPQDQESAQRLGIRELILKPDTVDDLALALDRVVRGKEATGN